MTSAHHDDNGAELQEAQDRLAGERYEPEGADRSVTISGVCIFLAFLIALGALAWAQAGSVLG